MKETGSDYRGMKRKFADYSRLSANFFLLMSASVAE
jgi:hypothetical protein